MRRLGWAAGCFALALTGVWALRPLPAPRLTLPAMGESPAPAEPEPPAALDLAAFSTPLWVAPPPPPQPPPPPPPPPPLPPLKIQLIAIVAEPGNARSVLVYDPEADRLLTLRAGDAIAGRTVEQIAGDAVRFKEGASTRTITLADAAASPGGPAR